MNRFSKRTRQLGLCMALAAFMSSNLQNGAYAAAAVLPVGTSSLSGLHTVGSSAISILAAGAEQVITPEPALPGQDPAVTSGSEPGSPTVIPEPTIIPTQEPGSPTVTPVPTITPTSGPTVTPSPGPGVPGEPTITPEPSPTPKPTPTPFVPDTLKLMTDYDYVGNSVTGISKQKESVKYLQALLKSYGKLYGTGMPFNEYKTAMSYKWTDTTEYNKEPVSVNVDITKSMDYNTYVDTLKKLSRYEGVYLYKIGKSTEGRDLYAIELDVKSDKPKKVFMLTGQVHAREFAGGTFIVREFADLIQKAQTDADTMEFLKNNKFVAVPIVNVDGREAIIKDQRKWTTYQGQLWKAYTNGVEGNRNLPGLQWGEVAKGNSRLSYIESRPAYANYPGSYAGSNSESKAMMKWLYTYVVLEQATAYLDLHDQGSIVYAGKTWQTLKDEQLSLNLRSNILNFINQSNYYRKYYRVSDGADYGLHGEGTSLTDYAVSLAVGARFSPAYGFLAFTDNKKEYILMQLKDLDYNRIRVKDANPDFAALTIEIGYGDSYLGNSYNTRKLLAQEYTKYHFDKLLENLPSMVR